MKASVIVVHYNTPELTGACVESVLKFTKGVEVEVIVVDNASTQGDISALAQLAEVHVVHSDVNLGFARGNNLGIAHSTGDYIILLNSDAELIDDTVSKACLLLAQNPDWGVVSGKLTYADGRPQYPTGRFASIWQELGELLRYPKWAIGFDRETYYLGDTFEGNRTLEVDWVWGALFCFSRKTLIQLPQARLADDFFMYYEDVQWCRQVRDLGLKVVYTPELKALHHLSGSAGTNPGGEIGKYVKRILPNEWHFMIDRYGHGFAIKYYGLKALHLLTQQHENARLLRRVYWEKLTGAV